MQGGLESESKSESLLTYVCISIHNLDVYANKHGEVPNSFEMHTAGVKTERDSIKVSPAQLGIKLQKQILLLKLESRKFGLNKA